MRLPPWTIRLRLILGFGLTTSALVLAGFVGIHSLGSVEEDARQNIGRVAETGNQLFFAHDATLRLVALAQAQLMGTEPFQPAELDSLTAFADSIRWLLVHGPSLTTEERARLEELGGLQGRIEVRLAVARAYRDLGRLDDAFRQAGFATRALDSLFVRAVALQRAQQERAGAALERIEHIVATRKWILSALLLLGLGVAAYFSRFTWLSITRPLDGLVEAARTLGRGDLRVDVPSQDLDFEYRELADAFNETTGRLRRLLAEVQQEAESVAQAATALNAASEQAADSTGQISTVVAEIAREAEAQREHVRASEAALGNVGEAAKTVGGTARRSHELGQEIRGTAQRTQAGIAQAMESLAHAERVIRESGEAVRRLEAASQAVEKFVATVVAVADQTDLLSLNAAIEAARAGEHGRGFAVVADEVRKLAADSARAADDVRGIVHRMRESVTSAIEAFTKGVAGLGDVGAVSRTAAEALQAIDGAVQSVEEIGASVARAAEQSREAVQALVTRLAEIGAESEAQAAASEQAAAAAEETAATSEEVSATAHTLQESAGRLNALISRFRV